MHVFCSDIDGTLLNSERSLSARTIEAISNVRAAGHAFVLCSSRMPSSMRILEGLYGGRRSALIAYNGGLVLGEGGGVEMDFAISEPVSREIYWECRRLSLHASFFSSDDWYAWEDDRWTQREIRNTGVLPRETSAHTFVRELLTGNLPHKIMCMGETSSVDALEKSLSQRSEVVTYRSKDTYLEIASDQCSKGSAVLAVARSLGVEASGVTFFGDNYNDLPAFSVVGTSVAVANARPEVLAVATHRTARHHDDGVAEYIEAWLREN